MKQHDTKYCVYWIPCFVQGEMAVLCGKETIISESIKTIGGWVLTIKSEVHAKPDSTHIEEVVIDLTINDEDESEPSIRKDFKVKLESCEVSENGLIVFKYSLSAGDHEIFDHLRDYVYDLIKRHFHVHEHHKYFTSVRKGYYPEELIDLSTKDNAAIVHYVRQFYELLKEQLEQIEDDYKLLEKNKTDFSSEIKEARRLFYESCENVFGQLIYYNSIFNSRWNASCRLSPTITEPDEDLRRLAINYFSLVSRLESIYQSSRTAFYVSNIHENVEIQRQINAVAHENNQVISQIDKVLKESKKSNVISLGLGLISVILAIWSLLLSFKDNKPQIVNANSAGIVDSVRTDAADSVKNVGQVSVCPNSELTDNRDI